MNKPGSDHFLFDQVQLILAEKRTALSTLRTGIAIFALPLSVLSVLIATSRLYDASQVLPYLCILLILNAALILLGVYLILHALKRIRHFDFVLKEFKRKHSDLSEFLD